MIPCNWSGQLCICPLLYEACFVIGAEVDRVYGGVSCNICRGLSSISKTSTTELNVLPVLRARAAQIHLIVLQPHIQKCQSLEKPCTISHWVNSICNSNSGCQ